MAILEGRKGNYEIAGMDIYKITKKKNIKESNKNLINLIKENSIQLQKKVNVGDDTYFINITLGNLNEFYTVLPDDVDPLHNISIISEIDQMLEDVGMPPLTPETIEETIKDNVKLELEKSEALEEDIKKQGKALEEDIKTKGV